MLRLQGIYCTDGIARDNSQFAVSALDDMIWMCSDGGRPTNISHDHHKFVGWSLVNGLYMSHECSYVMGSTYIPESNEELKNMQKLQQAYFYKSMTEELKKYENAFVEELVKQNVYRIDTLGKWFYNGIALYNYNNVLYAAFPKLKEVTDDEGLVLLDVLLSEFDYLGQGVFKCKNNKLAIILHSFFRRSYSILNNYNFGFIDKLFDVYKRGNHSVKIRLETDYIGYVPSWRQCREYEYWYGPKYNDDIANIPAGLTRFESDEIEKFYTDIKSTEFIWQKKDDGERYQFEMEELRDTEAPTLEKNTYACRYLHALYDFNSKEFNHFDGAIRCYDLDSMIKRIDTQMDKMGHQSKYTKIFRIDGHISLDLWKSLITQYLCSNNSVYDYFGIPRPFPKSNKGPHKKALQDYVPYQIKKGDGVRLFVSYHEERQYDTTRCFCNYDSIELNDGKHDAIDFSTLEVVKALRKVGVSIDMPENVKVIHVVDTFHNIPLIFHSNMECLEDVNNTLNGIRLLMEQHVKNEDNEVYSFSLGWNIESRSVSMSIMGHVSDLHSWLKSFGGIPTKHEDFKKWVEQQNNYIHEHGEDSPSPLNAGHVQDDGILYLKHRHVLKDVSMSDLKMLPQGSMTAKIDTEDEVLRELLNTNQIFFAPLFIVSDARDEKTGDSYFNSPYSGIFHDTQYRIDKAELMGFVWTTSPKPLNIAK